MDELKKEILKEYSTYRIDQEDDILQLEEISLLLNMLAENTLRDILSDIKLLKKISGSENYE